MKKGLLFALVLSVGILAVGCGSGGEAPNAAGPEAKSGKTYSAEEANAAQPKRGGSDSK